MDTGTYSAVFRMASGQQERLDAVTENLANSATPGYRRSLSVQGKFDAFMQQATRAGGASRINPDSMSVDFSEGPYRITDNPLDMAVNGEGFFVLESNGRDYYTRNGSFHRSPDGLLTNEGGLTVQGEGGPIRIPETTDLATLTIQNGRTLRAGENTLGRLRVADFPDRTVLTRAGPTLFAAPNGTRPNDAPESRVINRTLEGSNSSVFEELTELISCTRAQEACQRMIRAQDQAESKAINAHLR
jgi:flagellar basal-body rod protein FlgF